MLIRERFCLRCSFFQRTENMRHGLPAAIDENKAQTPLMHADHPDTILVYWFEGLPALVLK
jgi:hypothetical protein